MNNQVMTGNCFLCGEAYQKEYWLLLDIALNATLEDFDDFLRQIWLECCGHMSGFYPPVDSWGRDEFDMNAYYCEECYEIHDCPDKEYTLPITNSPRTCVCGYDGELDVWE
ncbi:hypothetical protein FACS189491_05810 [Spirochaetia bacterium]|nr:hypothetical protein FACS189491_05810 [Spirochaetia bacterium]